MTQFLLAKKFIIFTLVLSTVFSFSKNMCLCKVCAKLHVCLYVCQSKGQDLLKTEQQQRLSKLLLYVLDQAKLSSLVWWLDFRPKSVGTKVTTTPPDLARRHIHTCMAYIRQKISTISSRSISPEASLSYIRKAHLRVDTLHCTLNHVPHTLYTVHCLTVDSVQLRVYSNNIHRTHCTLYIVHCTLYIVPCTLYTLHCTLWIYTVHCWLYSCRAVQYTMRVCPYLSFSSGSPQLLMSVAIMNSWGKLTSNVCHWNWPKLILLLEIFLLHITKTANFHPNTDP